MISRRQFLLGTGAGLILPSFYERVIALAFSGFQYATQGQVTWLTTAFQKAEHTGRALLEDPHTALVAIDLELPAWLPSDTPAPASVAQLTRAGTDAKPDARSRCKWGNSLQRGRFGEKPREAKTLYRRGTTGGRWGGRVQPRFQVMRWNLRKCAI